MKALVDRAFFIKSNIIYYDWYKRSISSKPNIIRLSMWNRLSAWNHLIGITCTTLYCQNTLLSIKTKRLLQLRYHCQKSQQYQNSYNEKKSFNWILSSRKHTVVSFCKINLDLFLINMKYQLIWNIFIMLFDQWIYISS